MKHYLNLGFIIILGGCWQDSPPESTRYFPLQAGWQWDYQIHTDLINEQYSRPLSIQTVAPYTFRDQHYAVRRTSEGTDYYLKVEANGIYRYAKRMIVENQPQLDTPAQMVLPTPEHAKVGQTWSNLSVPYTLHRISPNPEPPSSQGYRFNMTYTLLSLQETVQVPAGEFKDCWLVEGQAQLYVFADARLGYRDIAITTREWYAPSIGLVKLERSEPLDGEVFKGGRITMELTAYKH